MFFLGSTTSKMTTEATTEIASTILFASADAEIRLEAIFEISIGFWCSAQTLSSRLETTIVVTTSFDG